MIETRLDLVLRCRFVLIMSHQVVQSTAYTHPFPTHEAYMKSKLSTTQWTMNDILMSLQKSDDGKQSASVNFQGLYPIAGYTEKFTAKRKLMAIAREGVDYWVIHRSVENPDGGRPIEDIMLTVEAWNFDFTTVPDGLLTSTSQVGGTRKEPGTAPSWTFWRVYKG